MTTLFVAATEAEARYLPASASVLLTGIGKVAAATSLTRWLAARTPEELAELTIVNVGTAGALHPHLSGLFEVGTVLNHEISGDVIRMLGYDVRERLVIGPAETVLATGDVFVTDPLVRDALAARAQLVDMEGYAVAYVAGEFGVPVRMVKYVSDTADESAMNWNTAVNRCARVLGEWAAAQV